MSDSVLTDYMRQQFEQAGDTGFTCLEAEENILRRMIMRQGAAEDVVFELSPSDFADKTHAMIYRAIQSLVSAHKQADLISIDAEMTRLYGEGGWNPVELAKVATKNQTTIANWQDIKDLIKIVRDLSVRRHAIASIEELVGGLRDPTKDISETLNEIQTAADRAMTDEAEWVHISDVLINTFTYLERRQKGEIKSIGCGIKCVDKIIGGFFADELTIVAARPSVGKSAFGVNIAIEAARKGFKVGVVSAEMEQEGIGQRLFSNGAWVDGMKLRTADIDDESWRKLADALNDMSELPFDFIFNTSAVEDIVNTVRKKARRGELDILIVDYLQFLDTHRRFKEERHRIGYISGMLKRLARKAHIPVVALAQVTREAEGQMPTLRMLRESGNMEQDADSVIFLHRPESEKDTSINPLDKASWKGWKDRDIVYLSIGVAKMRNGMVGTANCLFDAGLMRYIEIDRSMDEEGSVL